MDQVLPILAGIRIASPCSIGWDTMTGDDRRRACDACGKDVYNLTSMTKVEVLELLTRPGEPACVHFYRRADGTVLTADCPVGLKAIRGNRIVRSLVASVSTAITATIALVATQISRPESFVKSPVSPSDEPTQILVTAPVTATLTSVTNIKSRVINWVDDALVWAGIRQRDASDGSPCDDFGPPWATTPIPVVIRSDPVLDGADVPPPP